MSITDLFQGISERDSQYSEGVEFHYGGNRPIVKPERSNITNRAIAQAISTELRRPIKDTDITIYCNGKPCVDNVYDSNKRYYVFFPNQDLPVAPEIHTELGIVRKDVSTLYLAELPIPLVTVSRICGYLGHVDPINFEHLGFNAKDPIVFGRSLPAAFQQIALKLSAAFAGLQSAELSNDASPSCLTKIIKKFLQLNREVERELNDILTSLLDSPQHEDVDFELVATAVKVQLKTKNRSSILDEDRRIDREIVPQENFRKEVENELIDFHLNLLRSNLVESYKPFEQIVMPLLTMLKRTDYNQKDMIQLIDVFLDLVSSTNTFFERFVGFCRQAAIDKKLQIAAAGNLNRAKYICIDATPEFGKIIKCYKRCLHSFIEVAPYGFVTGPITADNLDKTLKQAQISYAVITAKLFRH